jgi:ribosomal-protein-alanine N-acetyltransferase
MKAKLPSGIEHINPDEINAIFEIEQKCFPGKIGYSKRLLEHLIFDVDSTCLVEKQNGKVRGFLIVEYHQENLTCNIETVDVDPSFKNRGIGLKLLKAVETEMRQKGVFWSQLEVSEGNQAALKLYTKAGYKFKEKLEGYYKFEHNGTHNAIRLIKSL